MHLTHKININVYCAKTGMSAHLNSVNICEHYVNIYLNNVDIYVHINAHLHDVNICKLNEFNIYLNNINSRHD